jgi:hypothetical protein
MVDCERPVAIIEQMKTDIKTNREEIKTLQVEMRTVTETNNTKLGVLQENMCTMWQGMEARMDTVMDAGTGMLKSYQEIMEAYHQRIEAYQKGRWAEIKASQENMEVSITSIHDELEETIRNWVADVLVSVNQQTQGLHEEIDKMMEQTQLALQTSLDTQT